MKHFDKNAFWVIFPVLNGTKLLIKLMTLMQWLKNGPPFSLL